MTFVIQMFDSDTTLFALLEVVVPVHMFLQVNFALELFGTHITRLLVLHVVVLYVVEVVPFGSLPTTDVAHFFLGILRLLELWVMLELLVGSQSLHPVKHLATCLTRELRLAMYELMGLERVLFAVAFATDGA